MNAAFKKLYSEVSAMELAAAQRDQYKRELDQERETTCKLRNHIATLERVFASRIATIKGAVRWDVSTK